MTAKAELLTLEKSGLVSVAAYQPELEYLFRHALVQDAAYDSLLKQDRRSLHKLAAENLLSLYPERRRELAGVVGMHFERAGDPASAAEQFVIAGEHALERFAQREGVSFFARATELMPADDPRADLRLRAAIGSARAGWTFAGLGGALDQLAKAIALAEDRADRRILADAYFWEAFLGAGVMFNGDLRQGAKLLSEALEELEGKADVMSSSVLSGFLAITYARLGEFDAAERALSRAERLAAQGDEIARLDSQISRSALDLERGDIAEGSARAQHCAETSETLGAVACAVASNVFLGQARLTLEDTHGARAPLERGVELSLVTYMAPMRTLAKGMLGTVRARLGDLPAGDAGWNDALAAARAGGDRFGEAVTLWGRGRTHGRQTAPDWDAALSDLDAALALFEGMEARPSIARTLRDRAYVLRALGHEDRAAQDDARSRAIAAEIGLKDFS